MLFPFLQKPVGLLFLIIVGSTGCAEWTAQRFDDPSRDTWQKPQGVVEKLAIPPGGRVADLGAGTGYFTWHLAKAVGSRGTIYAVEIDKTALDAIFKEMVARGTPNVRPVRAEPHDARLPEPVDLVFVCDTYHHMDDRVAYFRSLATSLRPGGRVAILDAHPRGFVSGMFGHRISKGEVLSEMEAAGYRLMDEFDVVEHQHFQVFAKPES